MAIITVDISINMAGISACVIITDIILQQLSIAESVAKNCVLQEMLASKKLE